MGAVGDLAHPVRKRNKRLQSIKDGTLDSNILCSKRLRGVWESSGSGEGQFASTSRLYSLNLEIVRLLGRGGFGKVFLVKTKDNLKTKVPCSFYQATYCRKEEPIRPAHETQFVPNKEGRVSKKGETSDGYFYFAMKTMLKRRVRRSTWLTEQARVEQRVLSTIEHPFIIKCYLTLQTKMQLLFFTEYVQGGDLFQFLNTFGALSEIDSKFYLCEVLTILEYLHSKGIIYRDLKPENLMLCREGHVKLIDFGLCRDNFPLAVGGRVCAATRCGTNGFMAPEVYRNLNYGFTADWWSFGALTFFLMTRLTPYPDQNYEKMVECPTTMSKDAVGLISNLLDLNKKTRLGRLKGAKSVANHKFFKGVSWDLVKSKGIRPPYILESGVGPGNHGRFPWRGNPRVCSRGKNSKPFKNCVSDPFANFDYVSDDRLDEI